MTYAKRPTKQQQIRNDYFGRNKPLHHVSINSNALYEKGFTGSSAFAAQSYHRGVGVGIAFRIYSEAIVFTNFEGYTKWEPIYFKPVDNYNSRETNFNSYVYNQLIAPLEDTEQKRLLLAYLQTYTAPFTPATIEIKNSYKLVNVPQNKLETIESNAAYNLAFSRSDNRIFVYNADTDIATLQTFLKEFEGITKDAYPLTSLKDCHIREGATAVYLKPL